MYDLKMNSLVALSICDLKRNIDRLNPKSSTLNRSGLSRQGCIAYKRAYLRHMLKVART
jgi:hypothetical protein